MRARQAVLEIRQSDLDIIAAAVPEFHAGLSNLSATILEGCVRLSGEYTGLPVRIQFSVMGSVSVSAEDTLVIHIEDAALGSFVRLPAAWVSRVLCSVLRRFTTCDGVWTDGSFIFLDPDRLRLPFPLSLMEWTLTDIRILPGLIEITLL